MSDPWARATAITEGAQRRPRRRLLLGRILLDGGLAVFAVGALLTVTLDGSAGYQAIRTGALPPAAIPEERGLVAPEEATSSLAVTDPAAVARVVAAPATARTVSTRLPANAAPLLSGAPIPAAPSTAAILSGTLALLGLASVAAGLATVAAQPLAKRLAKRTAARR